MKHEDLLRKSSYTTGDLQHIVAILRGPDGCPWDAAQTHESIRHNFVEETYEAIEGINKRDDALLCEELGDVLLQVALHVQIAAERGAFTWDDVTEGICRKLIERHPHVFGDLTAANADDALSNWDVVKRSKKGQLSVAQAMASIPRELPPQMRAEKILRRAEKAGVDSPSLAAPKADMLAAEATLQNAEQALTQASDSFISLFAQAEHENLQSEYRAAHAPLAHSTTG
ncbi:MAG: MazG family protein [Oscillospiraceae bacterium]|nr:MazG family protein [Oscillospiraceae bacterium]